LWFLVTALGERRDAIARAYLTAINPIANPAIDSNMLTFENVAVARGLAAAPAAYRVAWFAFDNTSRASRAITETSQPAARVPLPPGLPTTSGVYIKVELSATGGSTPVLGKAGARILPPTGCGLAIRGVRAAPEV
jgi:hypothetical protein